METLSLILWQGLPEVPRALLYSLHTNYETTTYSGTSYPGDVVFLSGYRPCSSALATPSAD